MAEIFDHIDQLRRQGGRVAIATLVNTDGTTEGTLGEAFLDRRFATEAREAMARGASRTLFLEGVRALVEVFAPPAQLLVIGAGHVAIPLTGLARTLGYRTIVLDGRPRI